MGEEGFKKITSYQEGSVKDSAALDVLKDFEKIAKDGLHAGWYGALNHTQAQQEQLMDKALFIPCGTWIESEMADAPRADGYEFAMAPSLVQKEGDTRYLAVAMETMSIPAGSQKSGAGKRIFYVSFIPMIL